MKSFSPSILTLSVLLASVAEGRDWPQFRGPDSSAVAEQAGAPSQWSATQNLAWAIEVPGAGWSAPIVVGGKVLLTTAVPAEGNEQSFEVHCYDLASGGLLWKQVALKAAPREPTHHDNTFASESPASDGDRVYAYFGMNTLVCYDLSGEKVWQRDLGAFPMDNDWGTSSSPVVAAGKVFVQIDNEEQSHVVALDAATGEDAWRAERPDEASNWSTPVVWHSSKGIELVVGGATVRSYDPATGKELWNMPLGGRSTATATPAGEILYVFNEDRTQRGGSAGGLVAVKAGASGGLDVTAPNPEAIAWTSLDLGVGISSPLVYGGQVFVPERRGGVLRVHDAATGAQVYRTRVPGAGVFWASPLAVDGRVLLLDENGRTFALKPGPTLEVVGRYELEGRFWGTPAVADGALLIRSDSRLYCIRATNGA